MSDANRPEPAEPAEPEAPAGPEASVGPEAAATPEASVAPLERDAPGDDATGDGTRPKVERMDVDPETGEHLETDVTNDAVTVRRSPRYGSFLVLGAALGVLVALILTFAFPENDQFDRGQVFGFLLLWCAAGGLALGGVAALVIDRVLSRRRGTAVAEHESTHYADGDPES
ncbi:hypothetical protein GCM10017608_30670 [Agromyces luteolus]|uniref:hypothetical protein n=1 Tax=Agromyces luteolus TaxID=88373 RepID=UPI00197AE815|nr:hypothetical protein [Agromyces luteolus]GLK29131.1 hypothetical protein GCM10017608_30670 [Agromyces luteolus]